MAKLVFADGSEKEVEYNQAAKVYQILIGNEEPENEKQEQFCLTVKEVIFEKTGGGYERKKNISI